MLSTSAELRPQATTTPAAGTPYLACLVVGLGGLFAGVTGPLLSNFVPPLVRDALGDHRTAIGVSWRSTISFCSSSCRGRARRPIARAPAGAGAGAAGRLRLPPCRRRHGGPSRFGKFGIVGLIASIVLLYTGINIQRSPAAGADRRRRPVTLPLAGHWLRHVPDVPGRDRVLDARPDAGHADGVHDRGGNGAGDFRRVCLRPARTGPSGAAGAPKRLFAR